MLNIYICEDNPRELAMIKEKAENFIAFEELDIQLAAASPDPDEILKKARDSTGCGLYFLDIDLKNENTNGFLLAQNIRKIEPRCFIVFITSHIELSYLTYQYKVEALDFIIKDRPEAVKNKIHECILNAYEKYTGGWDTYKNVYQLATPGKRKITVYYNDILSFETSPINHKIQLKALHRVIEFSGNLSDIEKELNENFLRCHRSAIVNIRHITDVDYTRCVITLSDGTTCPLSTRKKGALKKMLKNFNS